jgi:hypothetical protein
MAKSNIDKLMELKQLYEQGILTKEEMEVEKQKILGAAPETPMPESPKTIGQQSSDEVNEPAEHSSMDTDESFFDKYKGYVIGGIVLLLVIAVTIFVPKMMTHPTVPVSDDDSIPEINTLALKGLINDKTGFTMHLSISGNEIEGTEHYDNQRTEVNLVIKGVDNKNGRMILSEYDGNTKAGTFEGTIVGETYSGTFTNSKGKTFPFSANIMTESALSKIEEEEKLFETTKIVYTKNTSSANVELSVDYPIKGTDALLKSTRKYINEIIANMFQIEGYEYKGSLNDGSSVINSYGKAKYDDLDKEWNENAYEGASAYVETIKFIKDFENEYCVSLCAHSYYFHGGVSNEFCDASTFRKIDGKHISIIKSENDKGLHRLIIDSVKNKLGENYENINDEFESSPVAGIIHLVKEGVQFDYQHYEIGPGYFGQVSITIPYEKIKPYLTEEAKNVMDY